MKKSLSISVDSEVFDLLRKRAEKNFMDVQELIQDILRRSMLSYKQGGARKLMKVDDKFVEIFSRQRSGRPRKKK